MQLVLFILAIATMLGASAWLVAQSMSLSRVLALVLFLISAPIAGFGLMNNLGTAFQTYPEIGLVIPEEYLNVVWFVPVKGTGIYILAATVDPKDPPRLFLIPWSEQTAEDLQQAFTEGWSPWLRLQSNTGTYEVQDRQDQSVTKTPNDN